MSEEIVYCPRCNTSHTAAVGLGTDGYPTTRWLGGVHDADELRRRKLLDLIVDEAATGFALAASALDFDVAAVFASEVLDRNDEEDP